MAFFERTPACQNTYPLPGSTGMVTTRKVVRKRVARLEAYGLRFPLLNYVRVISSHGYAGSQYMASGLRNAHKPKPDFSQLRSNGTLAVQAFELLFVKEEQVCRQGPNAASVARAGSRAGDVTRMGGAEAHGEACYISLPAYGILIYIYSCSTRYLL